MITAIAVLTGCRQDMHNQPKFVPQRGTSFFADGRSARPQVEHTVARGQLHEDAYFETGLLNGKEQDMMPFPVTLQVIERGQERFNVYCTPCHSRVGNGLGMIVQRGYKPAGNFHDAKRMAQPLSHYFYVISNGYGAMPDYSSQLPPEDRWAVASYIRALQLSQAATEKDVAPGAKVENLGDLAIEEGYQPSFAQPWEEPATAVKAMPENGQPAMGTASNPNAPASKNHPPVNPGTGNATKPPASH
jgi:Cytochrome C oxidase, cbb3-type, subunit III